MPAPETAVGYRELAGVLRHAMQQGDHPEGSTLPKQDEIAAAHGVNINTVRQAIRVLEAEGLVTPVRRRGTVVRPRVPMKRLGTERYAKSNKWKSGLVAFAADREATGRTRTPAIRPTPCNASRPTPRSLRRSTLRRVRRSMPTPGWSGRAACPRTRSPATTRPEDVEGTALVNPVPGPAGQGGGFAILTSRGMEPDQITETIRSRMPTSGEAETLKLPAGEPVVVLYRTTATSDGRAVEFARGIHAASRLAWTYTFKSPD